MAKDSMASALLALLTKSDASQMRECKMQLETQGLRSCEKRDGDQEVHSENSRARTLRDAWIVSGRRQQRALEGLGVLQTQRAAPWQNCRREALSKGEPGDLTFLWMENLG